LEARKQLGIQEGDFLEVSVESGRLVLELVGRTIERPVALPAGHLKELVGILNLGGDAVQDSARYDE
jgi:bifunctional DNA-binding transcriptional regulator/antitoxin component of YhaV-PrlF toxin-antitoxin module